jgi:phage-related protein
MEVRFFRTPAGNEPVRDFIRSFPKEDREVIGTDLKTVQFGWPVGMPICRSLGSGVHEVRTSLPNRREVRILFFLSADTVVLVHGFLKKSQKTPKPDLDLALSRKAEFERNVKASAKPRPKTT